MTDYKTFLEGLEEYRKSSNFREHSELEVPSGADKSTKKYRGCAFCMSNKERATVYMNHSLKDEKGRIICPVLRAYVCPLCSATGENAHTVRYCPRTAVGSQTSSFLKTPRNSTGRIIRPSKP